MVGISDSNSPKLDLMELKGYYLKKIEVLDHQVNNNESSQDEDKKKLRRRIKDDEKDCRVTKLKG